MPKHIHLAFLVAIAAAAQQAAPQEAETPTFRAGTELIEVSVVAQGKDGKPAPDLRREDFQLFDNGAPQKIRLFVVEKPAAGSGGSAPGTFTNRLAIDGRVGYSLLLFDNLNIDPANNAFANTARARIKALRALREIPPGDKIAIYALGCGFEVVREFTSDRESLLQRLNAFAPAPAACMDPPGERERSRSEMMRDPEFASFAARIRLPANAEVKDRIAPAAGETPTLTAVTVAAEFGAIAGKMQELMGDHQIGLMADHLAGIPGRKNLIWLTSRFRLAPSSLTKLANAGVAVYPVDTAGSTIALESDKKAHAESLRAIAAMTGGVAYVDRDDLDVAIREALTDGRISYTLGFYRPDRDIRKSVHQISVRVNRPDVTLRYRTSYTVEPPAPAPANPVHDLVEAMNRPVDETAIGMTVSAFRRQNQLDLSLNLDISGLDLEQVNGQWRGKAEFLARFMKGDGNIAGKVLALTMTFNMRPATYAAALQRGYHYHRQIPIPAKAIELNLLTSNLATGKVGTLTIPLNEIEDGAPGAK